MYTHVEQHLYFCHRVGHNRVLCRFCLSGPHCTNDHKL